MDYSIERTDSSNLCENKESYMMIELLKIDGEQKQNEFEKIYYAYSRYLYIIGLKIMKDKELASDILQQCYFKIYQNIDKIQDISSKQTRSFISIIMGKEAMSAERAAEDEMIHEFDQWEKENPDISVPKDIELKILDMADNFNKLRTREEKRNRLKKYIQTSAVVMIAAILFAAGMYFFGSN